MGFILFLASTPCQVEGLQGLDYLDSTAGKARCKEGAAHVMLAGEVDRIYLHAPDTIKVSRVWAVGVCTHTACACVLSICIENDMWSTPVAAVP